jgi:hypothetical protein
MTFGPGAVERFRELEQDLHPLALAWLRDESVEEHMGHARHRIPASVVIHHQGWSRKLKTAPWMLWLVTDGSMTPHPGT